MATTIHMQGGDIEVDANFDLVRHRLNKGVAGVEDYAQGNVKGDYQPFHNLSFKTVEGGRIAINPEKVIAVSSDLPKDTAGE